MRDFIKNRLNKIYQSICRWYSGYHVIVDPDEPDTIGGLGVIHKTRKEFHWTAKLARSMVAFYLKYWQWLWGIAIALIIKFL
ncbi:MAG: hypothetical protein E6Q59_08840 [Nitrosomonas sp.]|nr:MAG: hypothetical protein E6Q59_08840 [Nitrosomonas sp.]